MGLKTVISAGSKVDQWADKAVLKLGAQNTMKLNRKALELLGGMLGMFAYVADGDKPNQYYIALSKEEELGGLKGAKIGIVGDKNEFNEATFTQLQFNSATLGKMLFPVAATCEVSPTGETDDATTDENGNPRTPTGLTFHELVMVETREEADSRLTKNKPAKTSEKEGAAADGEELVEGEPTAAPEEGEPETADAGESAPQEGRASRRR